MPRQAVAEKTVIMRPAGSHETEINSARGDMMYATVRLLALILFPSLSATLAGAEEDASAGMEADREAIAQAIQSYVTAFNAQDADAMAEHWSPEGVYISRLSGERVVGRTAIAAALAEMFAEEGERQLVVATDSIDFISPNVALERGKATVLHPDESTEVTAYRGIFVRREGSWLIYRITEDEASHSESHYEQLAGLEWLIGTWVDQAGDDTIRIEWQWAKNRNYISRAYTVNIDGQIDSSGLQVIGWDARQEQIRSWLFDSDSGFIEGTWTYKEDRWFVQSVATLADGSAGSFTSIFPPLDPDSYSWQKVHRVVDGELLPNIDEVIVVRE